jgi:hypothetical protein
MKVEAYLVYISKGWAGWVCVVLGPFGIRSRNAVTKESRNIFETYVCVLWVVLRWDRVSEFRIFRVKLGWVPLGWVRLFGEIALGFFMLH